ncbi:MAG: phosphate-starvation-inducible PsiE family protein [Terriglobales bacterium]
MKPSAPSKQIQLSHYLLVVLVTPERFRDILPAYLDGKIGAEEIVLDRLLSKVLKGTVVVLAAMLALVVVLSTAHLAVLIGEEIWMSPRFLIPVQGLLEVFGYFLLVMIGVELLETVRAYLRKDVIHVRVVLEVALIAMARKVIILESHDVTPLTFFGIAALILALGIAFYFERQSQA